MGDRFSRTELLLGREAMERLARARVAVFGVGGVGSYAAEALARSGVGTLDIVDDDRVCITNLNRQLFAAASTVGRYKVEAARERLLDIAPDMTVNARRVFFTAETADMFDFAAYDYVVDAIDTVSAKLELALRAQAAGTPIISSMGAGNKLDPAAFRVSDIYETSVCPLARVMRRELKKRGVRALKVVWSPETARTPGPEEDSGCGGCSLCASAGERASASRRQTPGSVAFVPSVAGLILAGEVVRDLTGVR